MTWRMPTEGWIKCNYDISDVDSARYDGFGWIIRTSNGVKALLLALEAIQPIRHFEMKHRQP